MTRIGPVPFQAVSSFGFGNGVGPVCVVWACRDVQVKTAIARKERTRREVIENEGFFIDQKPAWGIGKGG